MFHVLVVLAVAQLVFNLVAWTLVGYLIFRVDERWKVDSRTLYIQNESLKIEAGSLGARMDAFEIRLQTQEAWIHTTRQKLIEQGFKAPDFKASSDGQ